MYALIENRKFYSAPNTSTLVLDHRSEPLCFDSTREARAWVENSEKEVYYLANDEVCRPVYEVTSSESLRFRRAYRRTFGGQEPN